MKYQPLPKHTPKWLSQALLWLGGALGISISIEALIALYGINAYLHLLFFPSSPFRISVTESVQLGVIGAMAGIAVLCLTMLALDLNSLHHKAALVKSLVCATVLAIVAVAVSANYVNSSMSYPYPLIAVTSAWFAAGLGGVLPYMILRTDAAQKIKGK